MQKKILLFFSYAFGFLATSCCLPPLVFLLFGFGISFSVTEALEPYRWYLSALAIGCFLLYSWYFRKDCKQACKIDSKRKIVYFILGICLGLVLFYPEILGWFYA